MFTSLMPDLLGLPVGGPFETLAMAKRHGFAGVDLRMDQAAGVLDREGIARFVGEMGKEGLRGYCSLIAGRVSIPQGDWEASVKQLPALCALARSLGYTRAATVVLPGHDTLVFEENDRMHIERIRQVMPVLREHGIRLGLEYVSPRTRMAGFKHPYVHDLRGALELIERIGGSGVGLMLDSFHWHCAGETEGDLLGLSNEMIVVVHANDAMAGRGVEEQVVNEREMPGDSGVIDLKTFFGALVRVGYDGPVTCEPTHAKWAGMEGEEVLKRTARALGRYVK